MEAHILADGVDEEEEVEDTKGDGEGEKVGVEKHG